MPKPRRSAGRFVMSCSSKATEPASGCSSPAIILNVVVLPQPEGPSRPKNSPRSTSSETSATAAVLSKRLERFFRESSGILFQTLCFRCRLCVSLVSAAILSFTTRHKEHGIAQNIISYSGRGSRCPNAAAIPRFACAAGSSRAASR